MSRISVAYGLSQIVAALVGGYASDKWGWLAPFAIGIGSSLLALFIIIPLKEEVNKDHQWTFKKFTGAINKKLLLISLLAMVGFFVAFSTLYGFSQTWAVKELETDRQELGLVLFAMLVPYTLFLFLASRVQRFLGTSTTLALGMVLLGLGAGFIPFSSSLIMLSLFQALAGAGLGLVYPTTMAESIKNVGENVKDEVMGVFQSIYALGIFLGPVASGIIATRLNLNWIFLFAGSLSIAAIILVLLLAKTIKPKPTPIS